MLLLYRIYLKEMNLKDITPLDVLRLRRRCQLGRSAFARALGTTPTSVWKWEKGLVYPCGPSRKLLEYLDRGVLKLDPEEFRLKLGRKRRNETR